MTTEEVIPFLNQHISLVIPLHRRISMSMSGDFYSYVDKLTKEVMYCVSTGDASFIFPLNDIHFIEFSINNGIVVRLTN